jgi:hypothetical protein
VGRRSRLGQAGSKTACGLAGKNKGEERDGGPWSDLKKEIGSWAAAGPKDIVKSGWARRKERKGEKVLGLWVFVFFFFSFLFFLFQHTTTKNKTNKNKSNTHTFILFNL